MPPKAPPAAATSGGTKTRVSDKVLTQFTSNLFILLTFIMVFVVPKFKEVYSQITTPDGKKLELPGLTKGLIAFAEWLLPTKEGGWGIVILPAAIIAIWLLFKAWGATAAGRRAI